MKSLLGCAMFCLLMTLPAAAQQAPNKVFTEVGLDQDLGSWVPLNLKFRDEQGAVVPLTSFMHGKPVVLALVYYQCPMICTEVLNGMVKSFNDLPLTMGKDYEVVTVSINPNEQPSLAAEKKGKYAQLLHHPEGAAAWHFLTGEDSSIKSLAAAVGYRYVYDEATKQYAHPTGIIVLTPKGQVARYLYGVDYPPKDLKFALVEASGNKIGSPVDKILLLCYHYDPATGTYGFVILNALRIGGILTLLFLGGIIGFYLLRDRKSKREARLAMQAQPANGSTHGAHTH
ncbi:MAG: SCO family protein [Bacteroidota bacterium]